jgi:hypothetical protein
MHVNIAQKVSDRLELSADAILRTQKESLFYNLQYGLRHPYAIYTVSISAVMDNFNNLITALEAFQSNTSSEPFSNKESNRNLIISTDQLIDSIMEHLDDCLSIIKSLFLSDEEKKYKKACRGFNESIKVFRDHVAKQVNYIKHSQSRIRLIAFYDGTLMVPGYYIDGILSDGTVGPHPCIHSGSNTAFSYYRETRFLLCGILFISELLAGHIKKLLPKGVPCENKTKDVVGEVLNGIERLPFIFFPDEYRKPVPAILRRGDRRMIRYPSLITKPHKMHGEMRITTEFQVDGVSKAYTLPYFGKDMK